MSDTTTNVDTARPTNLVDFSFRTDRDFAKRKAEAEAKGLPLPVEKKKTVSILCPLLTLDDIIDFVTADGKEGKMTAIQELIVDTLNTVPTEAVRAQLAAQPVTEEADVSILKLEECTFEYVANQPKATRSRALSDEAWSSFTEVYMSVMPEVTGKSEAVIANHIKHYKDGLKAIAKDLGTLTKLKATFDAFTCEPSYVEGNEGVVNYLNNRFASATAAMAKVDLEV